MASLYAQSLSEKGNFRADYIKGCAPFTVTITNFYIGASGTILYNYGYEEGEDINNPATEFTYTQPGTYTIAQLVPTGTSSVIDSLKIQVLDNPAPTYEVYNCSNNNVSVTITDNYYEKYYVDFGDGIYDIATSGESLFHAYSDNLAKTIRMQGLASGSLTEDDVPNTACGFSEIQITPAEAIRAPEISAVNVNQNKVQIQYTLNANVKHVLEMQTNGMGNYAEMMALDNPGLVTLTDLSTDDNFYCFRILALDACDGQTYSSNNLCSIGLVAGAAPNQNELVWQSQEADLLSYSIFRQDTLLANINDATTKQYIDTDVVCGVEYCYYIIAEYTGGRSLSKRICVSAISDATPPAISDATATVSGNAIQLQFEMPVDIQSDSFHVIRYAPDGSESSFDIDTQSLTDMEINPGSGRYCYTIRYVDTCGNTSEISTQICPVFLTFAPATDFNQLDWTKYTGWSAGTQSYMLEVLDENGNITETIDVTGQFSYEIPINESNQKLQYRIKVVSNGQPPLESFSNIVSVTYEHQLFFPSAFTPDHDGLNDTFGGKGRFIEDYTLKIFNRWGELLFVSNSLDIGWDGQYRGKAAPEGNYVYKADGTDLNGTGFSKAGSFVLLRKKL